MMIRKLAALVFCLVCTAGCTFLTGLLHMRAVEIRAWSPDRDCLPAEEIQTIAITFSAPMNRALTEDAVSLQRDEQPQQGRFSWSAGDTVVRFEPSVVLSNGHSYSLQVSESAEDIYGNSLNRPFLFRFITAYELQPPQVLEHSPVDGAVVSSLREPIRVIFSEPVDAASFYLGFSLSPAMQGGFEWDHDGARVEFLPLSDYQRQETYEVVLDREIRDLSGNPLAEECSFRFHTTGCDDPELCLVTTLSGGKVLTAVQQGGGVDPALEIEKDEQFVLHFQSAVPRVAEIDLISLSPPVPWQVQWEQSRLSCILCFDEPLEWNRIYTLECAGAMFLFLVNGPRSKPLSVIRLSYCPDLVGSVGETDFIELEYSDVVDFSAAPDPVFDFHLDHASEVQIDVGSFLRAFDLTVSHACATIALEQVEVSPLAIDPAPLPCEGQSVVRIHCDITENPAAAGTVTFTLGTALRDSRDNHLAEEFVLQINN